MLPVATPPNAVAYSSGMVRIGRMARVGVAFNLLLVGLIVVVYRLWVRPLLGVP
jgi:sodium-dependent dicarboxylate transporter 2/3/5